MKFRKPSGPSAETVKLKRELDAARRELSQLKSGMGKLAPEERKPAGEHREPGIEHVAGQAQQVKAQQVTDEIREPEALGKQNAHGAHADEQGAFNPHARSRENEGGIAKP